MKREDSISPSGNIAKYRLINTLNGERAHISPEIMEMMKNDMQNIVESYIGNVSETNRLVLEVKSIEEQTPIVVVETASAGTR